MELAWEEVVENDAWTTSKGWRPCPVSSSDPARFTTREYNKFRHPKDIPLPASDSYHQWVWCGDWNFTKWKYCKKWDRKESAWSLKQGKSARCRRRIWKRPRVRNNDETAQQSIREVVYENQRYLVKRWASPYLPKDRPHWSDVNGTFKTQGSVNNKLPLNWKWLDNEWQIDIIENETDNDGWQYAPDFNAVNWAPKRTILHHVRRRKFTRTRMRSNKEKAMQTRMIRTVSDTVKLKSHLKSKDINGDFDGTLVVSYTNQFALAWSTHGVIESSGYQCSIWSPKLGPNEYCLGYLLSAEKAYPTNQFLVIIKKNGSDANAFRRPTGLTLIWSTRFHDPAASMHGHFYKPVAPPGYVALGDAVISKKKGVAVTIQDFPKLVCIKKEFVDQYAELFNSDKYSKNTKSLIQPHTMIWNTKKLSNANVHCQLWTQPPFSNEVESAFFVCNKLDKPSNVYPRLNIRYVMQDDPDNITVHAEFMTKKGKGVGSQARKRFFILTSDKKLEYFETNECRISKGIVDLTLMTDKAKIQQSNTDKFDIPTQGRKWVFTCNSSQDSIQWVNQINKVWRDPKGVVMKIIAAQIQGQPMEDDDYKSYNNNEKDLNNNNNKNGTMQLFDAPLHEQVIRLLAKNLNIIRKILKGDIEYIKKSILDEEFKRSQSIYKPQIKKKKSSFKRTLSNENFLNSSLTNTSDDIMKSHNENKQSIYKYFDDAWNAVRLLLKYFDISDDDEKKDNKTEIMKKSTVKQVMNQIPTLREQTIEYIMKNISDYVTEYGNSPNPFEIIKMCDACAVVESFPTGRQIVVEHITNNLLCDIKYKYASNTQFAGCKYIKQRFEDYNKLITHYDEIYSFFIPSKWIVPVTFSLQFCKLTGDQINEYLKINPQKIEIVMEAKQICISNEKKLEKEARIFLCQPHTELDKDEIEHTLPNYIGIISSILDEHLTNYISTERRKAEECVLLAKNETFNVLSEDGSLIEMYEGGLTKNSIQKHKSCELLLVAIRCGFKKCIQISRGQQLVNLLLSYQKYLIQYHNILSHLICDALETNNVIIISPLNTENINNKLTERYLYNCKKKGQKKRDRNSEDIVIQQILTFLVLVFNTSLYCKESMLNLGKASNKAIESIELKKEINFRELHEKFESLQFKISERLSQLIICRIVQDMDITYKLMDFKNMNEKDYIKLEKCRYLVESEWSNLAIQLLYIMPIAHYKLMIKRCVYLLAEFVFENTLKLVNINNKISKLLMHNYIHIKSSILIHLANESQHLASEIESASNIIFAPTDILYDLLCTQNQLIPALHCDDESNNTLIQSLKTKFGSNHHEKEPIFYKKYTLFEMKIVNFYHTSTTVLCFQTLLLQLAECQIKVNRTAKTSVKPIFFEAFNFNKYIKPELNKKLKLKKQLIDCIMKCKSINIETQNKIKLLYINKKPIDMKQEQQNSISKAIIEKEEWQQKQKEIYLKQQQEREEMEAMEKLDIIKDKAMTFFNINDSLNNNNNNSDIDIDDDDDVIVMTQTIDVKDVDNTIVKPQPEFQFNNESESKTESKSETEIETETETEIHSIVIIDNDKNIFDVETEENYGGNIYEPKIMAMSLPKPKKPNKSIKTPPSYRPPPPKIPNMAPPPIPRGKSPSPSPKPPIPQQRPPSKPNNNNNNQQGGLFSNVTKWFVNDDNNKIIKKRPPAPKPPK